MKKIAKLHLNSKNKFALFVMMKQTSKATLLQLV